MNIPATASKPRAQDPHRLIGLITGHWQASALYVAEQSGLFEFLQAGPRARDLVGRHLGWPERSCDALIDACLGIDLIRETPSGFELTEESAAFLVRGRQGYIGAWIREEARTFALWSELGRALESGRPIGPVDHNGYFLAPPEFHRFLHGVSSRIARELCEAVSFEGERVLDLGGGSGAFAIAIASAAEGSSVLVVDKPKVCEIARDGLTEAERSLSIDFLAADFFRDELPAGSDTILLANVLHDWSLDQASTLLKKARRALRPGGRIVVVEVVPSTPRSSDLVSALLSLSFCLTLSHGFCYDEDVYRDLLESAGLRGLQRIVLPRTHKLVLCGTLEAP